MIKINLLPVRQIKKRIRSRNEVLALAAGLMVVVSLLAVVGYSQTKKIDSMKQQIGQLKTEKNKYTPIINQIKKIEKEKKILETKLEVIKNLKENSQIPVRVLDEIANLTPPSRIWLKSLSFRENNMVISGIALDNETIAQYMTSIMASPYFDKAELQKSALANVAGQKLKSFGMTIDITRPQNPATASSNKNKKK